MKENRGMEKMEKGYKSPTLRVVEFRVESGYLSSLRSLNEGFEGELLGNELFWDEQYQGNEGFFGETVGNEGFIE